MNTLALSVHTPLRSASVCNASALVPALWAQQVPTNNRGGVATSSSAPQELPVLKKQPKRKAKDTAADEASDTRSGDAIEKTAEHFTEPRSRSIETSTRQALPTSKASSVSRRKAAISPAVLQLVDDVMRSRRPADALDLSQPSKKDLHLVLDCLVRRAREDKAIQVLDWIVLQPRYEKERATYYSGLVAQLGKAPSGVHRAFKLHDSIRGKDIPLDLIAYNVLISASGKAGLWVQSQAAFQEMQNFGLKPDVFTYTSLMKACQSCGNRWKQALAYADRMRAEGVRPNVTTYTTLISCCQRAGRWKTAMALFREMEESGIRADVKAYNSVISSCARGARWENAWEVCSSMRRAGCQPDTRTYNALISACERAREPERALEAYRKMRRDVGSGYNLTPTLVTLNTLISACAKGGLHDVAHDLYDEMKRLGIRPDVFTLSALISSCNHMNYWEAAMELAQEFDDYHGVRLNTVACNALITTLGKAGRWQYALQYFERLARGELDGQPDSWSYTGLILACRGGEQFEAVLDMYNEMQGHRMSIYRDVYHAALEACERLARWQQGREVLLQLQRLLECLHVELRTQLRLLRPRVRIRPEAGGSRTTHETLDATQLQSQADAEACRQLSGRLDMAAWQAVFAFPPLMQSVPKPFITVARAAVHSGKAARRLVSSRPRERADDTETVG